MSTERRSVQAILDGPTPGPLCDALKYIAFGTIIAGLLSPTIDNANRTVTAHICEMVDSNGYEQYGVVLAVHATAGGATGPMAVILTGVPAAGQVLLEYVSGQPKLTFAVADAVTACRVHWIDTGRPNGTSPAAALAYEMGVG